EEIKNASIELVSVGGSMRKLSFRGDIGDGEISAAYSDTGEGASLQIYSPEGGRVLRFADFYSRVDGGNLTVSAARPGRSGALAGAFDLTNFDIVGEPAMQHVVSTASGQRNGRSGYDPNRVR